MTLGRETEEVGGAVSDPPRPQSRRLSYREMAFAFLGDASLTVAQRAVGVVLILRANPNVGFRTGYGVEWPTIAALSGYDETTAQEVLEQLIAAGWFRAKQREADGAVAYQVTSEKRADAKARRDACEVLKSTQKPLSDGRTATDASTTSHAPNTYQHPDGIP